MVKPYEHCATRLENRGKHPPSRQYVDELVEGLLASGVEAGWHSAVDYDGRPLFPSEVYPVCHPEASTEAFEYLIERLHGIGRPVVSWYPLNRGGGVLAEHPDWRMQFMAADGGQPPPDEENRHACLNSPYGELLPRFAAEVVGEVGFDGVWFDGSTLANHSWGCVPGCVCGFCRDRFKRDTGLDLPREIDFDSHTFRIWVNWRYEVLMDVWRRCVDAVRATDPAAVVCFNNYRRRSRGTWRSGIPLRTLGWDALMSGELDGFPGQADIQIKINRAYGLTRGTETWWPLCDHWNLWVPDHEPLTAVQAVLGCVSAGGVASTGVGVAARLMAPVLKQMQSAAAPRMPFLGGEPVEYAAILASQQTMDFYATPQDAWDGIHGANEFCRHAHVQSSVVFDDHVERGELSRFPVVLVGNAACLSMSQARQLEAYVRGGGVLAACHEVGTRDELGYPHERPVLDELLGIRSRSAGEGAPTLEMLDADLQSTVGAHATFKAPHTLAAPTADVELLANVVDRTAPHWDGAEDDGAKSPRYPGLWVRRVGQGAVVYCGVNCFTTYLRFPVPRLTRLLRAILTGLREPDVTVRGPLCLTMNVRVQADGRWAVHLHNAPGTAYAYPNPPGGDCLHGPGEVVPIHDVVVEVASASVQAACSGLSGQTYEVRDGRLIHVPLVELQEIVLVAV